MQRPRLTMRLFVCAVLMLTILGTLPISAQEPPPYLDPTLPIEERVEDLLARMSLAEKIGQMTLIEKNSIAPEDVTTFFLGGVLSGGGGYPQPNTPEAWAAMVADFQNAALATPLGIPVIYGVDAVHGHNNLRGAVIFPHNVGLGATRDADLVRQIGVVTAQEMIATNIYWNYAPVIAVPQDIRWGRTYEGFGENTDLVTELGTAYLLGLQGADLAAADTVLGTPKHYIGDGGAVWGTSPFGPNNIDRGVTEVDEATLRTLYLPPYAAAIEAGARNIMISFSSWSGLPMHAQSYLINDVLKGELGFTGFTVSDWAAIDAVATDYYDAVVISVNAGLDMIMVPQDTAGFIDALTRAAQAGDVSLDRIDDAVRRILRVKFELGLFERPLSDGAQLAEVGSEAHRALARQAVQESLVLLKNENATLPLAHDVGTVFIAGMAADDIGTQSGGWTIEWQGGTGDITPGTSLRAAIEAAVSPDTAVYFDRLARFRNAMDADGNPLRADVGIVVIGEPPYAEQQGDSATLELPAGAVQTIERLRERADRVVVILLSGRPLIITDALNQADAFVAAWLPGTEGAGVTDVLFGDAPFSGQLSYTWPRAIDQIPFDFATLPTEGCDAPLFPYGYGLTAENPDATWTDLAKSCADYVDPLTVAEEAAPEGATTPAPVASGGPLAPDGEYGETYYAPFPVAITLDGDFNDWAGVPTVTMPDSADLTSGDPAVTFAAAADDTYLYLRGDVIDSNIISGQHEAEYWNEDSVEFYINATGDPGLTSYTDGVAQITLPALNAGQPPEEAVIGGMQGPSAEAEVVTVLTDTGWAVEVAVPLHNAVWDITPAEGAEIGFQVHLNGAATSERDTKLIWSLYDDSDQSYLNPSVFGTLIFTEAQVTSAAACDCPPQGFVSAIGPDGLLDDFESGLWLGSDEYNAALGFAPWGNVAENLNLSVRQLVGLSAMGIPGKDDPNNVLAVAYDITGWGGFTHAFTDGANWISLDWSAYNAVSFWLYGNETGGVVQMDIFDNRAEGVPGDSAERYAYRLDDDFAGWRYVTIPFDLFTRRTDWQPSGAPNDGLGLDQVSGYAFGFPAGAGPQIAYLDDVRLVTVDDTSAVTISETVDGAAASAEPEPEPFVVDESVTWDSRAWTLFWSDEFEGDAGTPIDAAAWTCEIGGEGWGNNELEYYTGRVENVSLDGNGNLAIVAREENPADYHCHYGTCTHTSARCITQDKVEFTYGRVEARLKLPYGQGIWPAFWMLGANFAEAGWPNSGEIDVMENVGFEPMTVHGTLHGPGYSGGSGIGGSTALAVPLSDDFHVYAVDWDPNVIRWYVDGELYFTASINDVGRREWVFDHDFFLLLNVAVGGNWPGFPDDTTVFPQTMLVDYVRVYQLAE